MHHNIFEEKVSNQSDLYQVLGLLWLRFILDCSDLFSLEKLMIFGFSAKMTAIAGFVRGLKQDNVSNQKKSHFLNNYFSMPTGVQ